MKKAVLSLLIILAMLVSLAPAEKLPATRAYFENLDKESRLEDIVDDIGNYGIEGSGILYFVWHLDDGSSAKVVFSSNGRIMMIYIDGEYSRERIYRREFPDTGSDADHSSVSDEIDLEEAVREMRQAIGELLPASGRISYSNPAKPEFELFDITGDGCADLCRCVTWGSGMVRTDLVVYDPVEKKLYVLDGYNYNYLIDHVEKDRIVIVKEGPYGYNEPLVKTYGTVITEDGRLVFVPDSEAP